MHSFSGPDPGAFTYSGSGHGSRVMRRVPRPDPWNVNVPGSGPENVEIPGTTPSHMSFGNLTPPLNPTLEGTPPMALQLGDTAPDFTADSTEGSISFHDWIGDSWCILFSHPKDYTPVCTTELGAAAKLKSKFADMGVKIIGLSVDGVEDHNGWSGDIEETQGVALNFPLLADPDRKVSDLYGMIHPNANDTLTVRSVFVIDPNKKVRLTITYPASTGRNFDEVFRVVQSLQLTDKHKVATPVNWKQGEDVIIVPALSDDEADKLFPGGYNRIKPYLRTTKCPS